MMLKSCASPTLLAGAIALALSSCAPPSPSIDERFASLSAECQSERASGAQLIEKESDVTGSEHYLLSRPEAGAEKKINNKATSALGETQYLSIDQTTRVFVECLLPSTNYAYVRVVSPDFLQEHRGWVNASALTANLSNDAPAISSAPNQYLVTSDTRDTYQEQKVEFEVLSPAKCGGNGVVGVRGEGTLKIFNPPQTMQVVIFPDCGESDETMIKLPDGRVLYLRKAL
jgi:hypothetical protein